MENVRTALEVATAKEKERFVHMRENHVFLVLDEKGS